MALRPQPLNNRQKAAILMVAIGPDAATELMQHMSQEEVEVLTVEIARMGRVNADMRENIIEEFHELCVAQEFTADGGLRQRQSRVDCRAGYAGPASHAV